jgi:3-oxoacyl-[acyl-carrier protein] reductase
MPTSSFLQDKHAVVFDGGGSIGAAVAREFASDGAEVFLAGRTPSSSPRPPPLARCSGKARA